MSPEIWHEPEPTLMFDRMNGINRIERINIEKAIRWV